MYHLELSDKKDNQHICINCGRTVRNLYKKYSNSVKTLNCDKCRNVADKYIEFEIVIALMDAVLLSKEAFRHILFNHNFKIQWKLCLVLLLLESFTLWRKKRSYGYMHDDMLQEKGFYVCCVQNMIDYMLFTFVLLVITLARRPVLVRKSGLRQYTMRLVKSIVIGNFSKFFLLPIMVWRANTTELGSKIHQSLVMMHHLLSLIYIYALVGRSKRLQAAFIILPAYYVKECFKYKISILMEENL